MLMHWLIRENAGYRFTLSGVLSSVMYGFSISGFLTMNHIFLAMLSWHWRKYFIRNNTRHRLLAEQPKDHHYCGCGAGHEYRYTFAQ